MQAGYNNVQVSIPAGTGGVEKGRFVKISSGTAIYANAITDQVLGVTTNGAAEGELVGVVVAGEADVQCAAALTLNGLVMTDTNGRAATAAGSTAIVQGRALEVGRAAASGKYAFAKIYLEGGRRIALG